LLILLRTLATLLATLVLFVCFSIY